MDLYISLSGFLLLWMYLFVVRAVSERRRPDTDGLEILTEPPDGISPCAARYLYRKGFFEYEGKVTAALLISMAAKGFVTVEEKEEEFAAVRTDADDSGLTSDEKAAADSLFKRYKRVGLTVSRSRRCSKANRKMIRDLEGRFGKSRYTLWGNIAVAVFLLTAAVSCAASALRSSPISVLVVIFVATAWYFIRCEARELMRAYKYAGKSMFRDIAARGHLLAVFFLLSFSTVPIVIAWSDSNKFSPLFLVGIVLMVEVLSRYSNYLRTLEAPQRDLHRKVEGFRAFLSGRGSDNDRNYLLSMLSGEYFEKYLPYALALDVESEWDGLLAEIGSLRVPEWYSGTSHKADDARTFLALMAGPFADAAAAATEDLSDS